MGADVLFLLQFESLEQDLYDRVAELGDELIRIPEADTHWIRMRGMVMSQLRSKATLDHGDRGYLRISSNTGERLTDAVRRSVRDEFSLRDPARKVLWSTRTNLSNCVGFPISRSGCFDILRMV